MTSNSEAGPHFTNGGVLLVAAEVGVAPVADDFAVPWAPDGDEAEALHSEHVRFGTPSIASPAWARRWLGSRHPPLLVAQEAQKHDDGDGILVEYQSDT